MLGGTDWANLCFTTPLDLALQMAAPFLVERGVEPADSLASLRCPRFGALTRKWLAPSLPA